MVSPLKDEKKNSSKKSKVLPINEVFDILQGRHHQSIQLQQRLAETGDPRDAQLPPTRAARVRVEFTQGKQHQRRKKQTVAAR